MNVTVNLSGETDGYIIKNLYPLYLHDLSEFSDTLPNEHGILEPDAVRTLSEQGEVQNIWWQRRGKLLPFLIRVELVPAGFAFIVKSPEENPEIDFCLQEFFIVRAYRRTGVGRRAAEELFRRFPGQWELYVLAKNLNAQAFWRAVLMDAAAGTFETFEHLAPFGALQVFRFRTSEAPS
jgi:aminoglycoside 6'-N-acetyltransferase I